jgi:hypothetical protein
MKNFIQRRILIVTSDWHAGHKLGLMNPATELYEDIIDGFGNVKEKKKVDHELTHTQYFVWHDVWLPAIQMVKDLAAGDPVAMIINGDVTQGDRHPEQLVTSSIANQVFIAEANLQPWIGEIPGLDFIRFSFGTDSHIFSQGTAPVLVNKFMRDRHPEIDCGVVHHGLLDVAGVTVDYAHHGPSQGIRLWTEGNQLRYYTKSIMLEALKDGQKPPALIVRSHFHYPHAETVPVKRKLKNGRVETVKSTIVLTPSMCGLSDYAHKATKSTNMLFNGFMVFEIIDGAFDPWKYIDDFVWCLDTRTIESIQ